MLTFTEWLNESYDYKEEPSGHSEGHAYGFADHRGEKFKVFINKDRKTGHHEVVFGQESVPGSIRFRQTHEQGTNAKKVFSTVHQIMKHHAKNNPDVKRYTFTSSKHGRGVNIHGDEVPIPENSRNKLYRRMTDKLGGYSQDNRHEVVHHIPAHSLRDS